MKIIIAPCTSACHIRQFVVNVDKCQQFVIGIVDVVLENLIVLQPCRLYTVVCVVVQDRVQVDMCLWRASVNTVHYALDITEYLLGSKVQSSAGSNVVCAYHHKYLGRAVGNVAFDVFALLGRVGT